MAVKIYYCDPGGDILLVLSSRGISDLVSAGIVIQTDASSISQADPEDEPMRHGSEEVTDRSVLDISPNPDNDNRDITHSKSPAVNSHFLVSSRHMILASPVFKTMLGPNFMEGLKLRARAELELPLPDDDPDAFRILLDIVHGHNRKVPREVDLPLLTRIAILVDKYQMLERVEIFSDMWIDQLLRNKCLPKTLTPDLWSWLTISWIFKKAAPFKETTYVFEMLGDENMGGEAIQALPVPDRIIEKLKRGRVSVLGHVLKTIYTLVEKYQTPTTICLYPENERSPGRRFACDSMVLGTLIKGCIIAHIWPIPVYPYHGITVQDIVNKISSMKIHSLCEINKEGAFAPYSGMWKDKESHGLVKSTLTSLLDQFSTGKKGLNLEEFT